MSSGCQTERLPALDQLARIQANLVTGVIQPLRAILVLVDGPQPTANEMVEERPDSIMDRLLAIDYQVAEATGIAHEIQRLLQAPGPTTHPEPPQGTRVQPVPFSAFKPRGM